MNKLLSGRIENWCSKINSNYQNNKSHLFSEIFLDTMDGKNWVQKPKAIDNTQFTHAIRKYLLM